MSSPKNVDKRRVWWASEEARAEYLRLPPEVREMADFATTNLQNDREHEMTKLKGKLKGIEEVKCDHGGEAYRYSICGTPQISSASSALFTRSPPRGRR
jgi:hypothetical protein